MISSRLTTRIASHRGHLLVPAAYIVAVTLAGCVQQRPMVSPLAARAEGARLVASPTGINAVRVAHSFLGSLRGALPVDNSILLSGTLGVTVNQVVPIPGTDMIKVGSVQEGSLYQSSARNPQQGQNERAGATPVGATVLFHIDRP